jgi:hypothetical protein
MPGFLLIMTAYQHSSSRDEESVPTIQQINLRQDRLDAIIYIHASVMEDGTLPGDGSMLNSPSQFVDVDVSDFTSQASDADELIIGPSGTEFSQCLTGTMSSLCPTGTVSTIQ